MGRSAFSAVVVSAVVFALLAPAGTATVSAPTGSSVWITKAQYGKRWPFKVTGGLLSCVSGSAVTFRARGTTYAVNGTARMWKLGREIRPIWRDDPSFPGLKVNIGPIIDRGLRLC